VLKCVYFVAVIDGAFCLDARLRYKRETLLVLTLEWSEIMGTYNTLDTIVRDRMNRTNEIKNVKLHSAQLATVGYCFHCLWLQSCIIKQTTVWPMPS